MSYIFSLFPSVAEGLLYVVLNDCQHFKGNSTTFCIGNVILLSKYQVEVSLGNVQENLINKSLSFLQHNSFSSSNFCCCLIGHTSVFVELQINSFS